MHSKSSLQRLSNIYVTDCQSLSVLLLYRAPSIGPLDLLLNYFAHFFQDHYFLDRMGGLKIEGQLYNLSKAQLPRDHLLEKKNIICYYGRKRTISRQVYSGTCLERPLSWEAISLERPDIPLAARPACHTKATCLEKPHFYGQCWLWCYQTSCSKKVLLYYIYLVWLSLPGTSCTWQTGCSV